MGNRFLAYVLLASGLVAQTAPTSRPASEETTATVDGRVVDLRGEAVPLAEVWIADWREPMQPLAHGTCDGEGFFRLAGVPKREWWTVRAGGQGHCEVEVNIPETCERVQVVVHDAVLVRGRIRTRAGKGVAHTMVRVDTPSSALWGLRCEAVSDGEGAFVLPGVPLGPMRLSTIVPGEGLAELRTVITRETEVQLAPVSEPTTKMTIELVGVPAAELGGARVEVLPYVGGSLVRFPAPWAQPTLATNGTAVLEPVPDRKYYVSLECPGFAISPRERRLEPNTGPHVARFTATRLGSVALRWPATVVGQDGLPREGMRLKLGPYTGIESCEATSDAAGKLVFACPVPEGTPVMIASVRKGFVVEGTRRSENVQNASSAFDGRHRTVVEPEEPVALRLVQACSVSGRVMLGGGVPAVMLQVDLEVETPNQPERWRAVNSVRTDRDGRFLFARLRSASAEARVRIVSDHGVGASPGFLLDRPGKEAALGDIGLQPAGVVEGVARTVDGAPAPGVRIEVREVGEEKESPVSRRIREVITDRAGRFRLAGTATGRVVVRVLDASPGARGGTFEHLQVEPGKTSTCNLVVPD